MNLFLFLKSLEDLELGVSKLYQRFSGDCASDGEASSLFYRLCIEERGHASLLRYQRRLIKRNPQLFESVSLEEGPIEEMTRRVGGLLRDPRRMALGEVVRAAVKIESSAAEHHHQTALLQSNPEMAKLLGALGAGDNQHLSSLLDFGLKRGFLSGADAAPFPHQAVETPSPRTMARG